MLIWLKKLDAKAVLQKQKWRFRLRRTFFGLSDKYMESVYEQFFLLKYYGGWSFMEAYNLPVGLRNWFIKRLVKQFEKEKEDYEQAQKNTKTSS